MKIELTEELKELIKKNIEEEKQQNAISFFKKAKEYSSFIKNENKILVVSHLDADGLTSAAIILKTLQREGIIYDLKVVQTVDQKVIEELKSLDEKIIFVDIGSGQLELINKLKDKKILILDHHEPSIKDYDKNILHFNPHDFNLDGSNEISGAGTTYVYSRMTNKKNKDLAYLAIIGAIGDVQEHNGFIGLNKIILEDAIKSGKLKVKKGVKLFGAQTKNIVSLLTYNQDLALKNITGSETAVIKFLEDLNIKYEEKGKIKRYIDLTDEERQKLTSAMIIKRSHLENPTSIIGYYYSLTEEKRGSPLKDAREYATLLNACGRMDAASIGIAACMGNEEMKRKAITVQKEYKKAIGQAINWFKNNKNTKKILFKKKYVLIDGRGIIKAEIIGTLASIVSRMEEIKENTFIISIADADEENYKVSLRIKGEKNEYDLRNIMTKIAEKSSSQAGGHSNAAGALVPKKNIEEFLKAIEETMKEL